MSITKKQILDAISDMSVVNVVELIKMIEKKFGISSSSYVPNPHEKSDKSQVEKTEFDVILNNIGNRKISVIKSVRSISGLGLKEAKDLVESAPVPVKTKISKSEAESVKKQLEESGASVQIK